MHPRNRMYVGSAVTIPSASSLVLPALPFAFPTRRVQGAFWFRWCAENVDTRDGTAMRDLLTNIMGV